MHTKEETLREKPFRFRPMLLFGFACAFGVFFAFLQYIFGLSYFLTIGIAVAAVVFAVVFRKKKFAAAACVLLALVNVSAYFAFDRNTAEPYLKSEGVVTGRVTEIGVSDGEDVSVTLEDVTLDGEPLKLKMNVIVFQIEDFREGDRVRFTGNIRTIDVSEHPEDASYLAKGIGYCGTTERTDALERGDPGFFGRIRNRFKDALLEIMPRGDAGVALSLLFGRKEFLAKEDYVSVQNSGTAHIFAVSGLHVGFLVGAALWILKKLRANRFWTCGIVGALLLFYGFLVGFTPSFNRAAVMCLTLLFSAVFIERYDTLSALSVAAVVILAVDPLSIFTVSFQLSFGSVLGIVLLYRPIKTGLIRFLRFDALSSSCAMSLSATFGALPVLALYFQSVPTYFLLSNLVMIPLVGIAYLLLFCAAVPVLAAPGALSFLLYPAYAFCRALLTIATLVGSLPGNTIVVPSLKIPALFYYATLAFGSRYCILSRNKKIFAFSLCLVLTVALAGAEMGIAALPINAP